MNNPYFVFEEDGLITIDQTKLPNKEVWIKLKTIKDFYNAIRTLKIRGAPAIGIATIFAIYYSIKDINDYDKLISTINKNISYLSNSRPTAVNLFFSIKKINSIIKNNKRKNAKTLIKKIEKQAFSLLKYEINTCNKIAYYGQKIIKNKVNILTHCNTGMLATPGIGTALGIIYKYSEKNKNLHVFVPETRPLLQGSRLTVYELMNQNIDHTLITDNMRGLLFDMNKIDIVIVGADRIALNGDTANKIGTFESALMAKYYNIPFYVAAPISSFDFNAKDRNDIIIEQREHREITHIYGKKISNATSVFNAAFDITPAEFINGFITEKGIIKVQKKCIKKLQ